MPSKKRFFGGLVGANPLRSGSFQDPGAVDRVSSNEGVLSIDTAGPETSTSTVVVLNDYSTKTETQFNASNAGADDQFGTNCALSGDGTIAVFGAPDEDGASNTLSNYGAAYVYENGSEVAILRASDQSNRFGYDVAISKDGSLIVVASPFAPNGSYLSSGKLYIFEKPAGGWGSATTEDYQISTNNTSANLGRHVRLTDNGDTIIATATLSSQERVLVYNRGSAWSDRTGHNAQLSASNWGSSDFFGAGLSISGDGSVVAVGAPEEDTTQTGSGSVYIYHKPTNGWASATETHFIGSFNRSNNARFGRSCSLNEDGTILAIGEYSYGSSAGRIHVREYNGSTWSHSGVLTGAGSSDYLGSSVCISRDGNTIAGGAPGDNLGKGALHVYFKPSSGWGNASHNYKLTTTNVTDNAHLGGNPNQTFTQPLALSNDGRKVLSAANEDDDGATDSGSGFLFTATGGTASTTTTTTQTTQWFWGGLRGRDAIVAGSEVGDDKSLRFDGTNDYLNRVVTASNRTTWTWSAWVKRDDLSRREYLFSGGASGDTSNLFYLQWERNHTGGNNQLGVVWREADPNNTRSMYTTASYNDTSAWYHVVLSVDTTQSAASDKMKLYVDGTEITSFSTDQRSTIGTNDPLSVNAAGNMCMGAYAYDLSATGERFKGLMAEVHFIDGTAYDASYFGETRDGVWVPKEVTGLTYGSNGFYLDFAGNDTGVTLLLDGSSKTADVTGLPTITASSGISVTPASPDAYGVTGGAVLESADNNQGIVASGTNLFTLNEDFTLEAWVKIDTESSNNTLFRIGSNVTYAALIGHAPSSGTWVLYLPNANDTGWSTSAATLFTGLTAGSGWHHIAITKSGTTFRGFVDGVQTSADIVNATTFPIGNGDLLLGVSGTANYGIGGQWQDVRYTKGYVRYSGSFTPPTSALSADVSGITGSDDVVLLLNGDGTNGQTTFTDQSSAATTVSNNGNNVTVNTTTKKFGTGSIQFNSTNDWLYLSDLTLGTGDFTIETWLNVDLTASPQYSQIIGNESPTDGWTWLINNSGASTGDMALYCGAIGLVLSTASGVLTTNTWHHVALTKSGDDLEFFVDGTSVAKDIAHSFNFTNASASTTIGKNINIGPRNVVGYMDDFRITKGAALYPFHPPISALTNTPEYLGDFGVDRSTDGTGVTLLLDGDGTNGQTTFTDKSSASHTITTNGDTQVDTSVKKFGTGSIKFDGSGDYITVPDAAAKGMGSSDFTVEGWFRTASTARQFLLGDLASSGSGTSCSMLMQIHTAGDLRFKVSDGITDVNIDSPTSAISTNTWHHIAAVRFGNTVSLYIDGVLQDSQTVTFALQDNAIPYRIGRSGDYTASNAFNYNGNIDDFRITRGVARDIPAGFSSGAPISGGGWDVALTNDDTWDKPKNNFSVEGNITPDDQLLDTPNLRFASFDPTSKGTYAILSEGNLKITNNNSSWGSAKTDFAIPAGDKVYFEVMMNGLYGMFGVTKSDSAKNSYLGAQVDGWALYPVTGKNELFHDTNNSTQWGTSSAGGPSNRVFMCAVDRSAGKIYFGAEGKWFTGDETEVASFANALPFPGFTDADLSSGSLFPAISVNNSSSVAGTLNFGQDHTFAGQKGTLLTPYSDANGVGEFYYQPPPDFLALADNYVVTDSLATTGVLSVSEMLQASL